MSNENDQANDKNQHQKSKEPLIPDFIKDWITEKLFAAFIGGSVVAVPVGGYQYISEKSIEEDINKIGTRITAIEEVTGNINQKIIKLEKDTSEIKHKVSELDRKLDDATRTQGEKIKRLNSSLDECLKKSYMQCREVR